MGHTRKKNELGQINVYHSTDNSMHVLCANLEKIRHTIDMNNRKYYHDYQ